MTTTRDKLTTAVRHHQAGRLQEAERLYGEILRVDPNHAHTLNLMGVILHQKDRSDEAIGYIRKAVRGNPAKAEYHNNLASAYLGAGKPEEAAASAREAIRLAPDYAFAYGNLGEASLALGRTDDAVVSYQRAIALAPEAADLHHNLGRSFLELGQLPEAVASFRRAVELAPDVANHRVGLADVLRRLDTEPDEIIAGLRRALELQPDNPEVLSTLGNALADQGRLDEAVGCHRRALEIDPASVMALVNLGNALSDQGELQEAAACYEKALEADVASAEVQASLAHVLRLRGEVDEAIARCQRALEIDPNCVAAHVNLGLAHFERGDTELALATYQRALELDGDSLPAMVDMGMALAEQCEHQHAAACYDRVLQRKPGYASARWNRALLALQSGDYRQGWRDFDWRWTADLEPRGFTKPTWDGGPLEGRRLLVYAEQGVGDEIMFASCLPDLIRQVGTFAVECDPRLLPLFDRSFPGLSWLPRKADVDPLAADALNAIDVQIAIGSLPRFYRNSPEEFPRVPAYLRPDPRLVDLWRQRLATLGEGLKIGISWRGGKKAAIRRKRSVGLDQWAGIFAVPGVHFVNLQYGDCREELERLKATSGVTVHDWIDANPLRDLETFAAEIAALDLVISVDNSTVHMAGALGTPTWGLLPFSADWRWVADRDDTPWYPSVHFFRQKHATDWASVFDRVVDTLRDKAQRPSGAHRPATPSRPKVAQKTAVLLNDTYAWYHWGCTATSSALRRRIAELNFHRVSVPINTEFHCVPRNLNDFDDPDFFRRARQTDARLFDTLEAADTVVINGEGTMHAVSERTASLLYIAYAAKQHLGKMVQIINHSAYPDDSPEPSDSQAFHLYRGVYQALDFVAVREHLSHRLLRQADVDTTLSFDCLPLTLRDEYPGLSSKADSRTIVVAGSVAFPPSCASALADYLRAMRGRGYEIRVLVGALDLLASDDREFVEHLRKQGDLGWQLVRATSLRQWFDCLASARVLVSGRFHHTIAACCLGVPAVVLGSNTPKMQAVAETFGLEPPLSYATPDLAEVLVHSTEQALEAGPSDPSIVEAVCQRAEHNFDGLRRLK
jgi:tetratricopeptide (TPR) repeat protein/polysaccharide pyruvyl transferase WcaK-like protein